MAKSVKFSDEELEHLQELTGQSDAVKAVRTALAEYVRYKHRRRLKELSGKVKMLDNWRELEEAELRNQNVARRTGTD